MDSFARVAVVTAAALVAVAPATAQAQTGAERAYFGAVARYFEIPESEIAILGSWDLSPDEIPVVLFVARRAHVSPEALVALRESGRSWADLARRYDIGAHVLHLPLGQPGAAGSLAAAYERYGSTPMEQWSSIRLTEQDIIALVNVRVLCEVLALPTDEVMRRTGTTASFVELYAQLFH